MKKLSLAELNRKSPEEFSFCAKIPVCVVLDNIRSQHNIGAVFRTSDAFLIEKIYLCGITACPPNNDIHKSALGAENTVVWEYNHDVSETSRQLAEDGYTLVAIEQAEESVMLGDFMFDPSKKYALVFGNEVKGVSQSIMDLCHACIEIPQGGTKHSLNISVSAGIVLWEFYRHLS
jgi:23S rRNA (guanosine2251-2'-O)-methyltransferase